MIYFDHNATTPLLPEARQAWLETAEAFPGNPSSPHRLGSRAEKALDDARQQLAKLIQCDPLDIVWTSGATESNNLILSHLARTLSEDAFIWISAIEHPCILQAARYYFAKRHHLIPVGRDGLVDMNWIHDRLQSNPPSLVAIMAANNETGALQPWQDILSLCRNKGVPFLCDAAQWLGKLPASGLGLCDFVSGCAHKFGGPKGVGFAKANTLLKPLLMGGPQEDGRRAGTENVAGVVSMLTALSKRERQIQAGKSTLRESRKQSFIGNLLQRLPGVQLAIPTSTPSLWNTVSAIMPETECPQRWVVKLDKAGCAVSTGSACSSGKEEPSHVLRAMGLKPNEASRVLRISGGWETTEDEWKKLLEAMIQTFEELQ